MSEYEFTNSDLFARNTSFLSRNWHDTCLFQSNELNEAFAESAPACAESFAWPEGFPIRWNNLIDKKSLQIQKP